MPSERTRSFVISRQGSEYIDRMSGGSVSRSKTVNIILERYEAITRNHRPETLTRQEWQMLAAVFREPVTPAWSVGAIQRAVRDAIQWEGLDTKWKVDPDLLLEKLGDLEYASIVAMLATIEGYHAARGRGEKVDLPGG